MAPKPVDASQLSIGDRIVGTANTPLQFSFETFNITKLTIVFESVGGNFGSQNVTMEGSVDNTNWMTIQPFSFSAGNNVKKWRITGTTGGGEDVSNLLDFQYIRVNVPALGGSISCVVTYAGKP